jgi:hypothetical protein
MALAAAGRAAHTVARRRFDRSRMMDRYAALLERVAATS